MGDEADHVEKPQHCMRVRFGRRQVLKSKSSVNWLKYDESLRFERNPACGVCVSEKVQKGRLANACDQVTTLTKRLRRRLVVPIQPTWQTGVAEG